MKQVTCEQCQQSRPMNEMFLVLGRSLCDKCTHAELAQRGKQKVPEGSVARQIDPTICYGCGRDNGSSPLPALAGGTPVCRDCEQKFRNPSYPGWIKAAFAVLLILAVASCINNWRFFAAYVEIQRGVRSAQAGDLRSAVRFLDSANRRVPESKEVAGLTSLYRGLHLLSQEKATDALPHLRLASQYIPADRAIQDFVLRAEIGAAFDRKDYDQFLSKAKVAMDRNPKDHAAVATVASAFACKWAVTGDEGFRLEALKYLDQAKQLAGAEDPAFKEYQGRILYRLDSREIITREEYHRRFPGGYVRKGETQ